MTGKTLRWLAALGVAAVSMPLLVACGGGAAPPQPTATALRPDKAAASPAAGTTAQPASPGKRGGVLRTVAAEPTTLDPHLTQDSQSSEYVAEIFSGLVTINTKLQIVPDLAERWDMSADGKVYTFTLLQNARFQDGKPITAQDVKYSIERAADPKTKSPVAATYLGDVVGVGDKLAGKATEVSGARVVDDRTIELTIDAPKIYFIAKLTYPTAFVVDKANVDAGTNWTDKPNGSGPFKLKEFRRDSRLVLARNDNFYRTPALLDEVVFDLRGGSAMTKYENGEIDVLPSISATDLDRVMDKNGPLWKELVKDANGNPGVNDMSLSYVGFNSSMPPFDDSKVRQAFVQAVDKQLIITTLYRNMFPVADGILPPGLPGYNPGLQGLKFDPAAAKRLLGESKYAGKLPKIKFTAAGTGGQASPDVVALVDQWKKNLGVDVDIEQVDWPTFLQDQKARRYQLFESAWVADYPDPQTFLEVLFQSKSPDNSTAYSNPDVDRLLAEAATERDVQKRLGLYQQAEQLLVNDAAVLPLNFGKRYPLVKPNVQGLEFPPIPAPHYQYVWVS